jgi:hypothetical protein
MKRGRECLLQLPQSAVIPTERKERAFTRGPILKRSAGMGNVRASSDRGIGSAALTFVQGVGKTRATKMMEKRSISCFCASCR